MVKKSIISILFLFSMFGGTARAQSDGCHTLSRFVDGGTIAVLAYYSRGASLFAAAGLATVISGGLGDTTNAMCAQANTVIWDAIENTVRDVVANPSPFFTPLLFAEMFCQVNDCTYQGGRPQIPGGSFGVGPRGSVNDIMGGMLCARGMGCGNNDPY